MRLAVVLILVGVVGPVLLWLVAGSGYVPERGLLWSVEHSMEIVLRTGTPYYDAFIARVQGQPYTRRWAVPLRFCLAGGLVFAAAGLVKFSSATHASAAGVPYAARHSGRASSVRR